MTSKTPSTIIVSKTMRESISTLEVRKRLGDLLNRVELRHDQFIIERKGKPLAALVPIQKLEQIEQAARLNLLELLEKQKRRAVQVTQEEADSIANEAKHRQRKKRK